MSSFSGQRRNRKGIQFNPSRNELQSAMEDYLKKGGAIHKIQLNNYELEALQGNDGNLSVDEYLLDNDFKIEPRLLKF